MTKYKWKQKRKVNIIQKRMRDGKGKYKIIKVKVWEIRKERRKK